MTLTPAAREQMRKEFRQKTDEAFDAMFAEDQQEQLITLVQREDRVLQQGAELQAWLLERHLQYDPWADPAKAETLRCPQCRQPGVRDTQEVEPVPRGLITRAGKQELQRWKYRCPSCRTVFFPLGRSAESGS